MNKYTCSDDTKVSQSTINRRYSESIREITETPICGGCGQKADDHDHTISRKRCKELHKTELIWSPENWVYSCRKCHTCWESYKSLDFIEHRNFWERMTFLAKHDPEGHQKRMNVVDSVAKSIKNYTNRFKL